MCDGISVPWGVSSRARARSRRGRRSARRRGSSNFQRFLRRLAEPPCEYPCKIREPSGALAFLPKHSREKRNARAPLGSVLHERIYCIYIYMCARIYRRRSCSPPGLLRLCELSEDSRLSSHPWNSRSFKGNPLLCTRGYVLLPAHRSRSYRFLFTLWRPLSLSQFSK